MTYILRLNCLSFIAIYTIFFPTEPVIWSSHEWPWHMQKAIRCRLFTEHADSSNAICILYQKDPPTQQENILSTSLWLNQKQVGKTHSTVINPADNKNQSSLNGFVWHLLAAACWLLNYPHLYAVAAVQGNGLYTPQGHLLLACLPRQTEPKKSTSWQGDDRWAKGLREFGC